MFAMFFDGGTTSANKSVASGLTMVVLTKQAVVTDESLATPPVEFCLQVPLPEPMLPTETAIELSISEFKLSILSTASMRLIRLPSVLSSLLSVTECRICCLTAASSFTSNTASMLSSSDLDDATEEFITR